MIRAPARKYWTAIIAANLVGGVLVFVGAELNVGIQILGVLLLFPGSVIAAVLPLQSLWNPVFWRCCQTDSTGLSNALYLPAAIVINLLVGFALRLFTSHAKHGHAAVNGESNTGET